MIDRQLTGHQIKGLRAKTTHEITLRGGDVIPAGREVVIDAFWRGRFNVSWAVRAERSGRVWRSIRQLGRSSLELLDPPRPPKGKTATWYLYSWSYGANAKPRNALAKTLYTTITRTGKEMSGCVHSEAAKKVCADAGVGCEFYK